MTADLPKLPPPYYFHWADRSNGKCLYVLRSDLLNHSIVRAWPHVVVSFWDTETLRYGRTEMFEPYSHVIDCPSREEALRLIELLANLGEL